MLALPKALDALVERISGAAGLDAVADPLAGAVNTALAPTPLKNALTGTWLGHPVHPLLVAIPIGSWVGASALDLLGGADAEPGADLLVAIGLASTLPTIATGAASWSDLFGADRRVGVVHAASNAIATGCFAGSLLQRRRGRRSSGILWHTLGLAALTVGGWLGGHLTYRAGVGVDHTIFDDQPDEWTAVARFDDLEEGQAVLGDAGGVAVLIVPTGEGVHALADRCSHESGPLHEGAVDSGCVTCPWHGSVFRLDDGSVVRGPATAPQPSFEVRVSDGEVQVRARRS